MRKSTQVNEGLKNPTPRIHLDSVSDSSWLPTQNWEKSQEKKRAAKVERLAEQEQRGRRLLRSFWVGTIVIGVIAIVSPMAIHTQLSHADDVDPAMAYLDETQDKVTFGSRLAEATPIEEGTEVTVTDAVNPVAVTEVPAPDEGVQGASDAPVAPDVAEHPHQQQQPEEPHSAVPENTALADVSNSSYEPVSEPVEEVVYPPLPEPTSQQSEQVSTQDEQLFQPLPPVQEATPQSQPTVSTKPTIPEWWSIPSWGTSSAPQYEALGLWDNHYYIAHNWTSYGAVITNMRVGDWVKIDGQLLVVVDLDYFPSFSDYEEVRARFGWDVWCLQTCWGTDMVKVVALLPSQDVR